MKNTMKKIGILFVVMLMAMFCAVSASALEATGKCGDNVYWSFDETASELVISGTGAMYNYSYKDSPFFASDIEKVIIESGVTTIGNCMFYTCDSLKSVIIPNTIKTIGDYSFGYCYNLEDIVIPYGVTDIGIWAFYACDNLENITIPNSIIYIGSNAFRFCTKLKSVSIPDSVTNIGDFAFSACYNLENIFVNQNNTNYLSDENGVLYNKDKTKLLQYPDGNIQISFTVPESVIYIERAALAGCHNLRKITILNYNCDIYNENEVFDAKNNVLDGIVICGYDGSTAESYAKIYSREFISLGEHPHTYTSQITLSPTHLTEGIETFTCKCGDTYTKPITKIIEHTYTSAVTAPTCTEQGYTTYTCVCGNTYKDDYTEVLEHKDENKNNLCDYDCGFNFDPAINCKCHCHKNKLIDMIYSFIDMIFSVFGADFDCDCGKSHF